MQEIKNIILDLGGVIINLDIPKTISEFNKLSNTNFEAIYTQIQQSQLFDLFDKGQITEQEFINDIKAKLNQNLSNSQILNAWNAMLLDFPKHRLDFLQTLKNKYRIFLLSNTNETHITAFEKILYNQHGYKNLDPFFEKTYYSCRIGMRKPDKEIFEYVLEQNNLLPKECIFVDDSPQHIIGAKNAGITSFLLPKEKDIVDMFKELSIY